MNEIETTEKPTDAKSEQPKPAYTTSRPQRNLTGQIVGALIGAFIFYILSEVAKRIGWLPSQPDRLWLWGAVIGGLFGSADSLSDAGSRLTNKKNKILNIIVALVGMFIIFGIIFMMVSFISRFLPKLDL